MHEPTYQNVYILVQAKFICLSYVIYDVHCDNSKDTKIIYILSDYGMEKRQYDSRGVHDIKLDENDHYRRLLHIM